MNFQEISIIQSIHKILMNAEQEHIAVDAITATVPDLTVDEAYQAQMLTIEKKVEAGKAIVGKKIGLTSLAMQESLGVDQPDYGHLLDCMEIKDKGIVSMDQLFSPRVEGELAFILNKDLEGPDVTADDVINATQYIIPSIEIVDSRIKNWKIKLQDTIADNASSSLFILGEKRYSINEIDLKNIRMELYKNGEFMNKGISSDVLGNPAECVAWLANKLHQYNVTLKAGEVILSGAISAAISAESGDHFVARFKGLGEVEVSFK